MRKLLITSVSLALGITSTTWADNSKEVIASNHPKPRPAAPATNVAPVSYVARGQSDDKPVPAPVNPSVMPPSTTTPVPAAPLHMPMPTTTSVPPPGATFVPPSAPCNNCMATPFDPALSPLPTGVFAQEPGALNYRWYGSFEYLYWWVRDGALPPLVTTGSPNDPVPGVLNPTLGPTTQILYGNQSLDTQGRSGGRLEFGRWFGTCTPWAIEGGFFFLGQRSATFTAGGDGSANSPVIARPFFENNRQVESVEYVSFPGIARGAIQISSTNNFYGANIDWRRRIWSDPSRRGCGCWRVDGQIGFRYLNFDEDLVITENPTLLVPVVNEAGQLLPAGLSQQLTDSFRVNNDFYGAMFGCVTEWTRGNWILSMSTRVSLGTTRRELEIAGGQTLTVPGATTNQVGGLLARPSNIGTFTDNTFSVVPEIGFNVGYQFSPHWRFFVGYSFLYWSDMLRAGDQVDRNINLAGLPLSIQPGQTSITTGQVIPAGNTSRPAVLFKETDFWAQGVNVGFQWTW